MKRNKTVLFLFLAILILGFAYYLHTFKSEYTPVKDLGKDKEHMIIKSTFTDGSEIPKKYSCEGEGINPPLSISEVPPPAKSLILFVEDPDAPGGTFTHWMVWNINPEVKGITENSTPANAVTGLNSTGRKEYTPPCPPGGTHRYFFKIYALDTLINLTSDSSKKEVEKTMLGHIMDEGQLMGKYSRK